MSTIQAIIDLARVELNDPSKIQWTDAELVKGALAGIQLSFQLAPHLFFGAYSTMPPDTLTVFDQSPLPARYDRALADYVVGRAHLKDDEDARDSASQGFISLFRAEIGA